jgi:di/tripeptidase
MTQDLEFLKQVLSVPTKSRQEGLMVEFLTNYLKEKNYDFYLDAMSNIYVTKKTSDDVEYFPCVVSHTDTVHKLDTINVVQEYLPNYQGEIKLSLKAYNNMDEPTGIGGDDKCGVFACLSLLEILPNLKVAFFVSEEIGCVGSLKADKTFFDNVGYAIQFDAPENWMVTQYCYGQKLFDEQSEFFIKCEPNFKEMMPNFVLESHPYTDVYSLRKLFDFSCINFSCGYYQYHTRNEYVVVEDLYNSILLGQKLIESLGNNLYPQERINIYRGLYFEL